MTPPSRHPAPRRLTLLHRLLLPRRLGGVSITPGTLLAASAGMLLAAAVVSDPAARAPAGLLAVFFATPWVTRTMRDDDVVQRAVSVAERNHSLAERSAAVEGQPPAHQARAEAQFLAVAANLRTPSVTLH